MRTLSLSSFSLTGREERGMLAAATGEEDADAPAGSLLEEDITGSGMGVYRSSFL